MCRHPVPIQEQLPAVLGEERFLQIFLFTRSTWISSSGESFFNEKNQDFPRMGRFREVIELHDFNYSNEEGEQNDAQ